MRDLFRRNESDLASVDTNSPSVCWISKSYPSIGPCFLFAHNGQSRRIYLDIICWLQSLLEWDWIAGDFHSLRFVPDLHLILAILMQ